jgi:hypothetical protein
MNQSGLDVFVYASLDLIGQGRELRAPDRVKSRVKVFRGVKVFHENAGK